MAKLINLESCHLPLATCHMPPDWSYARTPFTLTFNMLVDIFLKKLGMLLTCLFDTLSLQITHKSEKV